MFFNNICEDNGRSSSDFSNYVLLSDASVVGIDLKLLRNLLQIMSGSLTIGILQGQRTQQLRNNFLTMCFGSGFPLSTPI